MEQTIVNRVANSSLSTLNPEDFRPTGQIVELDIKPQLYMGLILKEKDFRDWVKNNDWQQYTGCHVAITCSADAIVPTWAYILLATRLHGFATSYAFGTRQQVEDLLFIQNIDKADFSIYQDQRIVLKGCGSISAAVYVHLAQKLMPFVKSLMFGEPCSTVPLFKKS